MLAPLPNDGTDPLVRLGDAPEPLPRPDEAVVAVESFSLNRGELFLLQRPPSGSRPGEDIAGRVVRAAADGRGPAVGDRVVGHPVDGGWTARVLTDLRERRLRGNAVLRIPDDPT
jgi:NADPH:quinone reductase-like Zn-dependent oxidoreductase